MNCPEYNTYPKGWKEHLGAWAARLFDGHTIEDLRAFKFWESMNQLIKIDGEFIDDEWIKQRQDQLLTLASETAPYSGQPREERHRRAYSRARLEDYCRHQNIFDGRVVTRIPAYLADRRKLGELGIQADNFDRSYLHLRADYHLTVMLPTGWKMEPAHALPDSKKAITSPLDNLTWAAVYDEADIIKASLFYTRMPFSYKGDVESYTQLMGPGLPTAPVINIDGRTIDGF